MTALAGQNRGFSLAEMLVAMAIFATVMAGVIALYQGAITTVAQGRQTIQGFEAGRTTLNILENDLKRAFTAREHGDDYQFYGTPEGFMFVGVLPNGRLGRISYVLHRNVGQAPFITTIPESWEQVKTNIFASVYNDAFAAGATDGQARSAADTAVAAFTAAYPQPGLGQSPFVDFSVQVQTGSIIRYEEQDQTDLDTLDLGGLQWPLINPEPPLGLSPADWDIRDNNIEFPGANEALYVWLRSAINPSDNPQNFARDMRDLILDTRFSNIDLYAITGTTVEALVASKKRDIYLKFLADSPEVPAGLPRFWDRPNRPAVRDYILADNVVVSASLLDPITQVPVPALGASFDILNIPGVFAYNVTANGEIRQHFNTALNVRGYEQFIDDPSIDTIDAMDDILQAAYAATPLEQFSGTALAPRLPALVNVGFWIVYEKPNPTATDFRRWFTQQFDVPAAVTRDIPLRMSPNYDQAAAPIGG